MCVSGFVLEVIMLKPDSPIIPAPHYNEPLRDDPLPLSPVIRQDPKPPIKEPSTRRAPEDLLDRHWSSSSGDDQAARLAREQR